MDALARLVAKRLPDTRALQNGGVGDQLQLSDRLQRIEDGQGRLVELAVAKYIKQNEGSVPVAPSAAVASNASDAAAAADAAPRTPKGKKRFDLGAAAAKRANQADSDGLAKAMAE